MLVNVRVMSGVDVAIAEITVGTGSFARVAYGEAKRHPNDLPDEAIGEALALSRAMRKMTDKLEDDAWRWIEQNNHRGIPYEIVPTTPEGVTYE